MAIFLEAEACRAEFARASPKLLTFLDYPDQEVAGHQQRLRAGAQTGSHSAQGDCAVRIVTGTAKLDAQTPFQTITATLA